MTFDEWLNEIENFATREERLYDDFTMLNYKDYQILLAWLKVAWCVGAEHSLSRMIDDGK